ncbi:MAG: hypothetical protein FWD06_08015 [Oscillospiraceae bacterium]|nr:hypothetical protein [Oscillospiraceae bacterium]
MKIKYFDKRKAAEEELNNVTILLKKNELLELISALEGLLEEPNPIQCNGFVINPGDHYHLMSSDYNKEVTVALEKEE